MVREEARLKEFLRGATGLPVLPRITVRLLKALDSPDSSSKDIAKIIEAEPSLSARVLKLANSSFYGHRGLVSTVHSAVVVLGSKTIRSLALAVWTSTLKSRARNVEEMTMMTPLLGHGMATGVVARMLAERISHDLGEEAFMAGLLHDIGRVALVAQTGRKYLSGILEPAQREGVSLHEKESAVLGFDHRDLGSALLASWALPPFLVDVAEKHHDMGIVPENQFFVATTALADNFSTRLGFNLALDVPRPEPGQIAAFFGLADKEAVAAFLELCLERVREFGEILEKPD